MKQLVTLFAVTALAGCAALPDRTPPPQPWQTQQLASRESFGAVAGSWPAATWWRDYGDAQLDQLIGEALAGSPTVTAARARLLRARSYQDQARGALAPQLSAGASATEQKQSENYLSPAAMTPQGWNDYGRATLDLSWELDFWGKNRAALAAATSETAAAQAEADQASMLLAISVASVYAELAREYAALDTAAAARDVRIATAELFAQRFANGLETRGSLRQAESRRAASGADVLAIEEQITLQKNALAALLGAGPDRGLNIARPGLRLDRAAAAPATLSAELVGRRPDLVAARLRASAAAARIHVARAQFYPNVNLLAFVGLQSLGLDQLADPGSGIGSVGPALSLPLFTGGRLRAQLRGADAAYAEAVASYDQTLVRALQEVADALTSQRALAAQQARVDEAVDAAREAWRTQSERYAGGLSTYLEVLGAEDYLLGTLRTQSDLRSRALLLDIALVKSLGGGYSSSN